MKILTLLIILSGVLAMQNKIKRKKKKQKTEEKRQDVDKIDLDGFPVKYSLQEDKTSQSTLADNRGQVEDRFKSDLALIMASVPQRANELFLHNSDENRGGPQKCLLQAQTSEEIRYSPPKSPYGSETLHHSQMQQNYQQKLPQNDASNYQPLQNYNSMPIEFFTGRCIGAIRKNKYVRSMGECLQYCFGSPEWAPDAVSFQKIENMGKCACQSDLKVLSINEPGWVCAVNTDIYNVNKKRCDATGFYFEKNAQKRKRDVSDFLYNKNLTKK